MSENKPAGNHSINQVTCFIKFMMNRWSEESCAKIFPFLSAHLWEKWISLVYRYGTDGAIPRFYCELDDENASLIVNYAVKTYGNTYKLWKSEDILSVIH